MSSRAAKYGNYNSLRENIAAGTKTGEGVVIQWIVDEGYQGNRGHRDNIYAPENRIIGCATGELANEMKIMSTCNYSSG